jgi:hypothetical protein
VDKPNSHRLDKLKKVQKYYKKDNKKQHCKRKKKTIKKIIKIHNLGKKNGIVSVLIKSNKTRKLIKDDHKKMKELALFDVKKHLKKKNLIKIGTIAPEDVLRNIYEESTLAGDIFNVNTDKLLHNYINNDEITDDI